MQPLSTIFRLPREECHVKFDLQLKMKGPITPISLNCEDAYFYLKRIHEDNREAKLVSSFTICKRPPFSVLRLFSWCEQYPTPPSLSAGIELLRREGSL